MDEEEDLLFLVTKNRTGDLPLARRSFVMLESRPLGLSFVERKIEPILCRGTEGDGRGDGGDGVEIQ